MVADLPACSQPGDLLVVNNTRVFAARLLGRREPSGGAVECLLLRRVDGGRLGGADAPRAEAEAGRAGPVRRRRRRAATARCSSATSSAAGRSGSRPTRRRRVDALVDALGHMPLPPYIKRADTAADRERYQTVFAASRGSVAAPTAGLHFTREILDAARRRAASSGTRSRCTSATAPSSRFASTTVEAHVVDPEPYEISCRRGRSDQPRARRAAGGSSRSAPRRRARSRMRPARGGGRSAPGRCRGDDVHLSRASSSRSSADCSPTSTCRSRRC